MHKDRVKIEYCREIFVKDFDISLYGYSSSPVYPRVQEGMENTHYLMINHLKPVRLRHVLVRNGHNPVRLRP
jgi:hypothetical protein